MANIGCKIVKNFKRPDKALVDAFAGIPVANIDDCMNRTAAVHPDIKAVNAAPLLGIAFTVKVPEGDNLMFHKAMDMAQEGDVIVIDAGGDTSRSIFGEIMINYCKSRKLAGVIVDGSIRDIDTLSKIDFAVYARGVTPNGPYKNGPGEINVPISFGGKVIQPGDIIVGDADGLVVIKPEEAKELAQKAKAVLDKETQSIETILASGKFDRPWIDPKLVELGCEYLDE